METRLKALMVIANQLTAVDLGALVTRSLELASPELAQQLTRAGLDPEPSTPEEMAKTLRADVDVINEGDLFTDNVFGLWVDQDFNQPTRNSAALLQGGLAMPDRSYYLDPSPRMAEIRGSSWLK